MNGGNSYVSGGAVEMTCKVNRIVIPISREQSNLPIVFNSFASAQENIKAGQHILSAMAYSNLSKLDFFGDLKTSNDMVNSKAWYEDMIQNEHEHYSQLCGPCVGSRVNENISGAQREILLWNWKWGVSMRRIQQMMKPQQIEEPDGSRSVMAPVISPKLPAADT